MSCRTQIGWAVWIVALVVLPPWQDGLDKSHGGSVVAAEPDDAPAKHPLPSVDEARARAEILHETVHGALQVMHRDFFLEDQGPTIPSQSLEDVFRELTRSHGVELRWLVVNTNAMNVENKARTDFEKQAVKVLAEGKSSFESTEGGVYRHAGAIRLASQCLKCHLPRRTSTKDRAAGLVISMPYLKSN